MEDKLCVLPMEDKVWCQREHLWTKSLHIKVGADIAICRPPTPEYTHRIQTSIKRHKAGTMGSAPSTAASQNI